MMYHKILLAESKKLNHGCFRVLYWRTARRRSSPFLATAIQGAKQRCRSFMNWSFFYLTMAVITEDELPRVETSTLVLHGSKSSFALFGNLTHWRFEPKSRSQLLDTSKKLKILKFHLRVRQLSQTCDQNSCSDTTLEWRFWGNLVTNL